MVTRGSELFLGKKEKLLEKLLRKPIPKNFKKYELDSLMNKCGCVKFSGGRGSGIGFYHKATEKVVQFDEPHPGDELYAYQIKNVIDFLKKIGEI